jgi:hypothetical protein
VTNYKNKGVRRRLWKKMIKDATIGTTAKRTLREYERNQSFAQYKWNESEKKRQTS